MTSRVGIARAVQTGLALGVGLVWGPAAWAQKGEAEPDAVPQFEQRPEPTTVSRDAEPMRPRTVQGVQIGAAQPAPETRAEPRSPLDTKISVRVKGAPLSVFLDSISAQAKVNFIVTEGLEDKRVTAFLQAVTVREALQTLLQIKGLTYQQVGKSNTYVVAPRAKDVPNLITRIYTLQYIPLIQVGKAGGAGTSESGGGGGGEGTQPSGGGEAGGGAASGGSAGGGTGGVAILNVLRSVLSKLGKVAIDPRLNAMIVTDVPETFPQIEQIIAELDKKAPQVMLETQIVEIDSDKTQNLGIEWGGAGGELVRFTGGARDSFFPLDIPANFSNYKFFPSLTQTISALGSTGGGTGGTGGTGATQLFGATLKGGLVDMSALTIILRALVTRAEARFLGKPKILTLNNHAAMIQITKNEALGIKTTVSGSGGGGGLATAATQAEREETGLVLKVTPQVNREGYITLLVEPSFTDAIRSGISTAANPFFDPITRKANSVVRVRNGQTIVLGGLLQSKETKTVRKVPFLGYIPLLGWLFTSIDSGRDNTDLVIFITPTIISD